jgi:magnesium transporter
MPRHKSEVLEAEDHTRGITLRVPCMTEISEERIRGALARNHFFWLDLADPGAGEIERLGELFGFHPIAIEDTLHFGQRPKLDDFGNYVFLVFYGASERRHPDGGRLSEFHLFVSGSYLITVHRDPAPSLDEQRSSIEGRVLHSEQFVIYRVLDALTDTFFPTLSEMDETIDELEDGIIANPTGEQLQRIFELKRDLVAMRKVVSAQRDLLARGIDTIAAVPGLKLDERDYFRDVYDHMIRISDLIDSYRDLVAGAMDAYLSVVANRQNEVMKQLAIIATVFLPLSFLTGFFGMNFAFLVGHIQNTLLGFLLLGVGGCAASVVGLLIYFKRKRWA